MSPGKNRALKEYRQHSAAQSKPDPFNGGDWKCCSGNPPTGYSSSYVEPTHYESELAGIQSLVAQGHPGRFYHCASTGRHRPGSSIPMAQSSLVCRGNISIAVDTVLLMSMGAVSRQQRSDLQPVKCRQYRLFMNAGAAGPVARPLPADGILARKIMFNQYIVDDDHVFAINIIPQIKVATR